MLEANTSPPNSEAEKKHYHSLLDQFYLQQPNPDLSSSMKLEDIFTNLYVALDNKQSSQSLERRVLYPPRILRALIDYKVSSKSIDLSDLVDQAADLCIAVYKEDETAQTKLLQLAEKIVNNHPEILQTIVEQKIDSVTSKSSTPERSKQTAEKLAQQFPDGNIVFVALGHGGVMSGIDVYLRYCSLTNADNVPFQVYRFSRYKHKDSRPNLSNGEEKNIRQLSSGKCIVVYDEDIASGMTLQLAEQYFRTLNPNVYTATNYDARTTLNTSPFKPSSQTLPISFTTPSPLEKSNLYYHFQEPKSAKPIIYYDVQNLLSNEIYKKIPLQLSSNIPIKKNPDKYMFNVEPFISKIDDNLLLKTI